MKKWRLNFYTYNEELIETVEVSYETKEEVAEFSKKRSQENGAYAYDCKELSGVWIKSKVVVFFGLNNQFAGMYIADNQEQIDLIMKLVYDFPYYCKVYDDIPRISDSVSFQMNHQTGDIVTRITDIEGGVKNIPKNAGEMMEKKDELFAKIEEIFGSS